jgi:uncharacterized membrane protein YgdD (TMEM256/DUF423 family)
MNQKQTLMCGSILGLLGVALGAFGAHALKAVLTQNGRIETYDLAVRYQFYHALTLLLIGLLMEKLEVPTFKWASLLLFVGVVIFSGSLYLFALTNTTTFAMITPLGGVLMLFGWGWLTYSIVLKK